MLNSHSLADKRILISRTDRIGDVVLTLPMCCWIKQQYPSAEILFLGKKYTTPVLECLADINEIIDWDRLNSLSEQEQVQALSALNIDVVIHVFPNKKLAHLAKKAGIPQRVGTLNRLYHWLTCNIRPHFSRAKSEFHEAQLNFELLRYFGITSLPSLSEMSQWLEDSFHAKEETLPLDITTLLSSQPVVILHPKSQGSALEWPMEKYQQLALALLENGYGVIFTGTEKEGQHFREAIPAHKNCLDSTGKLTLSQLIRLLSLSQHLVACSTGPLHLAAIQGIHAIGLFSSRRPIHPGRWRPLGQKSDVMVFDEQCPVCQQGEPCHCIEQIPVERVLQAILQDKEASK